MGLKPFDLDDLVRIVEPWDPVKQRTAVASLVYYARHVEKDSPLAERIAQGFTPRGHAARPRPARLHPFAGWFV